MAPEKPSAALSLVASLIAFVTFVGTQGSSTRIIRTGSIISTAQTGHPAWFSNSGKFAFGFYQEGSDFAIGIKFFPNSSYSTVIWTADRDGKPIPANANLTLANVGLVLHVEEGDRTISDLYDRTMRISLAFMFDSGKFVVYESVNGYASIFWKSFDNPTDTLMAGQVLALGDDLISSVSANNHSSGRFRFAMQMDGNAFLYPVNTPETVFHSYWSLVSKCEFGLVLDQEGSLSTATASSVNSSQDMEFVRFIRIEADGYLRIYSTNQYGLMTMSKQYPSENNKCLIKGTCGLNSFCNTTGKGEVFCICLPGYVYIDASRVFAGCQRNFTKGSCDAVSSNTSNITLIYKMSSLANITWSDDSYSSFPVKSEDECSDACLGDCNCYAALFWSSRKRCSKQRYPFQYGKALFGQDDQTVAFFKIVPAELKHQVYVKSVSIGSLRMLGTRPMILSLLATAIFAVAFDFLIFFLCRYRIGKYRRLCESMESGLANAMAPRFFSYRQLEEATDGYKEKIGEGTYGIVFKGFLRPPRDVSTPIADKKLKSVPGNIEEKFRNELRSTDGNKEEIGEGRYGKDFKGLLPPRDASTPIAVKKLKSVLGNIEEKFRNELRSKDGYNEEICEGRYGKVFKGLLPPCDASTPIAVKKLKGVPGNIEEKFRNELRSIGRLHHRNLVRLLGYGHEGSDWILVCEYMSRGSLADLIFKPSETPLSWKQRASIAMDVATGLCHLHEGCDVAIIHGDIKPENVLIGNDNRAKIGDLGFAKHLQPGKHKAYTRKRGTFNYKAPELENFYNGVSTKADVFSFGVLLLELLWLMKFNQPDGLDGEFNLASWAYKCLIGRSKWQLPGMDVDAKELEEMVKVALWCLNRSPEKRPSMFDVVMMLSGKKLVQFPPVPLVDPLVDGNRHADVSAVPTADAERV